MSGKRTPRQRQVLMARLIEALLGAGAVEFLLATPFGQILLIIALAAGAFVAGFLLLLTALRAIIVMVAKHSLRMLRSQAFWSVLALAAFVLTLIASWQLGVIHALALAAGVMGAVVAVKKEAMEIIERGGKKGQDSGADEARS